MLALRSISNKLIVLEYLRDKRSLEPALFSAAVDKLGADLSDEMTGALGKDLLKEIERDLAPLQAPLAAGDQVYFLEGARRSKGTVSVVNERSIAIDGDDGHLHQVAHSTCERVGKRALSEVVEALKELTAPSRLDLPST
jgi:hypothetical protein